MACFLVPVAEAVVTTALNKSIQAKESESDQVQVDFGNGKLEAAVRIPFSRKVKWLTNMLWGGSALLAFEHLWHGEIAPWFPFLTAASDPEKASVMLHEMATVGVSMAALVTAVWGCMLVAANTLERRAALQLQPVRKQ